MTPAAAEQTKNSPIDIPEETPDSIQDNIISGTGMRQKVADVIVSQQEVELLLGIHDNKTQTLSVGSQSIEPAMQPESTVADYVGREAALTVPTVHKVFSGDDIKENLVEDTGAQDRMEIEVEHETAPEPADFDLELSKLTSSVYIGQEPKAEFIEEVALADQGITATTEMDGPNDLDNLKQELLALVIGDEEDFDEDGPAAVLSFEEGSVGYGNLEVYEAEETVPTLEKFSSYVIRIIGSGEQETVEGKELKGRLDDILSITKEIESLHGDMLYGQGGSEPELELMSEGVSEALHAEGGFLQVEGHEMEEGVIEVDLQERLAQLEMELSNKVEELFQALELQVSEEQKRKFVAKIIEEIREKVAITESKEMIDETTGTHEAKRSVTRWRKALSFTDYSISQFIGAVATQRTISLG